MGKKTQQNLLIIDNQYNVLVITLSIYFLADPGSISEHGFQQNPLKLSTLLVKKKETQHTRMYCAVSPEIVYG
jgi:hypothetical protein